MVNGVFRRRWRYGRFGLALGLVLLAGCQARAGRPRPPQPRELPFPTFEHQAPFPEYGRVAAARARAAAPPETELRRELAETAPLSAEPERQRIPVGRTMTASIPADEDWIWSSAGEVTVASYGAVSGGPGALIYVEEYSAEMRRHPAFEHLRFQATVAPELAEDYLQLATARAFLARTPQSLARQARLELARGVALMETRTLGQGLGFLPTPGTFTGWRWIGRNTRGVAIRCGRHLGAWAEQRPLPEAVVGAMRQSSPPRVVVPSRRSSFAASSPTAPSPASRSAYLVLGSATDREDRAGAHFAILCVREPRCLAYRELAAFLASIEVVEPAAVTQVASTAPMSFTDLLERVDLSLKSDSEAPEPAAQR